MFFLVFFLCVALLSDRNSVALLAAFKAESGIVLLLFLLERFAFLHCLLCRVALGF